MESLNNKEITSIKEAIVKTVAFFDLFDYPMTSWEIWILGYWDIGILPARQALAGGDIKYRDIKSMLDSVKLNNAIESKNGFYFLTGHENIIKTRMARYNYTDKKIKRALRVARLFKFIPWIKMIAVGNIMGAHNLKKKSDIDFFIVCEDKRIWLTRFFCAGLMKLLGLRPKEGNEQNKICLSFFVSENAMDLSGLMLGGGNIGHRMPGMSDIYFIYWLAGLALIYNKNNTYNKLINDNNWINEYLPNWQAMELARQRDSGKGFSGFYHDVVDLFFNGIEQNFKNFQLKKLPDSLKNLMNKGTRVVINNQVLKLHVKDRREEYRRRWMKKVADIEMEGWMLK